MRARSDITKGVARHRAVYTALRISVGWLICLVTGFTFEPCRLRSDTFVFLSNHTSDMDPVYEVLGIKRHMRFVASENALQGPLGRLVAFLAGPIPRRKGASSDDTVQAMLDNLACGVSVGVHPEGNRTWDGETCYIPPRIAQLVKDSGVALVTYRIDGGYIKSPRWASNRRRGKIRGHVINEYMGEQLSGMSTEEIYDALCRDLYADAFAEQARDMRPYKGRALGEGLERVLFVCPRCKAVGSFSSSGDSAVCGECGFGVRYDVYGFFEGDGEFKSVLDWSHWQKAWLEENRQGLTARTGVPISSDSELELWRGTGKSREKLLLDARAEIYGDRLTVSAGEECYSFPLAEIVKMGAFRLSRVFFTFRGEYYVIFSKSGFSGTKYFALWRILSGREYY